MTEVNNAPAIEPEITDEATATAVPAEEVTAAGPEDQEAKEEDEEGE
ncbi:hypothetical protein [Chitinophaga tropicalis]|uniref:Uncharacterized protein n=1 Tax=Chitinophaga tropicalis TaxID=2683588 RepID=A0A7K1UAE3_9BACT|nr:hypothetical protein [Chitinophaga tropicalis]MVT11344.1 hypothetical protein [Chitinophaga tropicalis]